MTISSGISSVQAFIGGKMVELAPSSISFVEPDYKAPDFPTTYSCTVVLKIGGTPTLNSLTKWSWRKDIAENIKNGANATKEWASYPMFDKLFSWATL